MTVVASEARAAAKEVSREPTVVLVGTVASVAPNDPSPPSRHLWSVTFQVEKVKSGRYTEPTRTFSVHSPTRAGLRAGGRYTIEATWNGLGYEVRESDIVLAGSGDEDVRRVEPSECRTMRGLRLTPAE